MQNPGDPHRSVPIRSPIRCKNRTDPPIYEEKTVYISNFYNFYGSVRASHFLQWIGGRIGTDRYGSVGFASVRHFRWGADVLHGLGALDAGVQECEQDAAAQPGHGGAVQDAHVDDPLAATGSHSALPPVRLCITRFALENAAAHAHAEASPAAGLM